MWIKNSQPFWENVRKPWRIFFDSRCTLCTRNKKMASELLLLVMLSLLIQSSQAVTCYRCTRCDEPTSATCEGAVCLTSQVIASDGAFKKRFSGSVNASSRVARIWG